jgi:DNA-binding MarR family transcriptional regulator
MPASATATLGTLLRHLLEQLDGAVEESYVHAGLDYKPRYTPVVRALIAAGPSSIRAISRSAGITHSAVSQTVAQMVDCGLLAYQAGRDARERIVALTPTARAMLPALQRRWQATNSAAARLDSELSMPLSQLLREAIDALDRRSFADRIEKAAVRLSPRSRRRK